MVDCLMISFLEMDAGCVHRKRAGLVNSSGRATQDGPSLASSECRYRFDDPQMYESRSSAYAYQGASGSYLGLSTTKRAPHTQAHAKRASTVLLLASGFVAQY